MKKSIGIPLLVLVAGFAMLMFFLNPLTGASNGEADEVCDITDNASLAAELQARTVTSTIAAGSRPAWLRPKPAPTSPAWWPPPISAKR